MNEEKHYFAEIFWQHKYEIETSLGNQGYDILNLEPYKDKFNISYVKLLIKKVCNEK